MRRPVLPLLAALLFLFVPARAQEVTGVDRFRLWDSCKPMQLVVEHLPKGAANIGLTKEAIETSARSRLRAARIYNSKADSYLYINVNVVGRAFSIGINYKKVLFDAASIEEGYAVTWSVGSAGTHGSDSSYILSFVSQHMDKFVDDYLRVNEAGCRR